MCPISAKRRKPEVVHDASHLASGMMTLFNFLVSPRPYLTVSEVVFHSRTGNPFLTPTHTHEHEHACTHHFAWAARAPLSTSTTTRANAPACIMKHVLKRLNR